MNEEKTAGQAPEREAASAPPMKLDVTVRAIDPIKNLMGFASVKFNDCLVVDDFKILQGEKGLYVGMPSKPTNKGSYRDTVKPVTKEFREQLQGAVLGEYAAELDRLQARVAAARQAPAPEKESIMSQLEAGKKQAARADAARPAKTKPAKAAER